MASKTKISGIDKLWARLGDGHRVTARGAKRLGVGNLRARIFDLRSEGFQINRTTIKVQGKPTTAYYASNRF